jgi:hypothetical protein
MFVCGLTGDRITSCVFCAGEGTLLGLPVRVWHGGGERRTPRPLLTLSSPRRSSSAEGLELFCTAFVPKMVPSAGSPLAGPHYVYHMFPWVSNKARVVFHGQRAQSTLLSTNPDALRMPVVFSLDDSANPLMVTAPPMQQLHCGRPAVKAVGF